MNNIAQCCRLMQHSSQYFAMVKKSETGSKSIGQEVMAILLFADSINLIASHIKSVKINTKKFKNGSMYGTVRKKNQFGVGMFHFNIISNLQITGMFLEILLPPHQKSKHFFFSTQSFLTTILAHTVCCKALMNVHLDTY